MIPKELAQLTDEEREEILDQLRKEVLGIEVPSPEEADRLGNKLVEQEAYIKRLKSQHDKRLKREKAKLAGMEFVYKQKLMASFDKYSDPKYSSWHLPSVTLSKRNVAESVSNDKAVSVPYLETLDDEKLKKFNCRRVQQDVVVSDDDFKTIKDLALNKGHKLPGIEVTPQHISFTVK